MSWFLNSNRPILSYLKKKIASAVLPWYAAHITETITLTVKAVFASKCADRQRRFCGLFICVCLVYDVTAQCSLGNTYLANQASLLP